jgi:hypothetical protein
MTTVGAMPMMGSYVAPAAMPMTTVGAMPQMGSYVAPAAMPMTTTVAAPMMTTATPSYVAPPTTAMPMMPQATMPMAMPQAAMPMAPPNLTQGMPTPEQIAAQKAQYAAALDKQLEQAKNTVIKETKIEQQMVKFNAEKQIDLYRCQVEEKRVEQEAMVEEQATIQALEMKKALVERNLQLDNQAAGLTMDYKMKELMTACAVKQYQFQQQYIGAEQKLAAQYQQQFVKAGGVPV